MSVQNLDQLIQKQSADADRLLLDRLSQDAAQRLLHKRQEGFHGWPAVEISALSERLSQVIQNAGPNMFIDIINLLKMLELRGVEPGHARNILTQACARTSQELPQDAGRINEEEMMFGVTTGG